MDAVEDTKQILQTEAAKADGEFSDVGLSEDVPGEEGTGNNRENNMFIPSINYDLIDYRYRAV